MDKSTIYTIGHGNKTLEQFITELKSFGIEYIFDVRSSPFSKFNPQFNQNLLEIDLNENNITYIYAGEQLGGLPKDPSCYINGKVEYNLIREKLFFKDAIKTLVEVNREKLMIALMCSETNPETCHRSKLIGDALSSEGIQVNHIVSKDISLPQYEVLNKLNKGKNIENLFGEKISLTSRKSY